MERRGLGVTLTLMASVRFNGATAFQPWKVATAQPLARNLRRFNGATAFQPWKAVVSAVGAPCWTVELQWGHGISAVERARPARLRPTQPSFNGATAFQPWKVESDGRPETRQDPASMGPRHFSRGKGSVTIRRLATVLVGFNGATAFQPWKAAGRLCGAPIGQ